MTGSKRMMTAMLFQLEKTPLYREVSIRSIPERPASNNI